LKKWQITGFLAVLIIGFLLISGCTQDNNKYCSDNFPGTYYDPSSKMCEYIVTQTYQITPTWTPTITATEDTNSIQTQLKSEWDQIRDVFDAYIIEAQKDNDFYRLRTKTIPNTISNYQKIKDELLNINIKNSDLKEERSILVSICEYKIKYLQGISSAILASEDEKDLPHTSLEKYTNAKLSFRDERDIISDIPYSSKYWDFIYNDDRVAEDNIEIENANILRVSKLLS
jgi:hypothetical protein